MTFADELRTIRPSVDVDEIMRNMKNAMRASAGDGKQYCEFSKIGPVKTSYSNDAYIPVMEFLKIFTAEYRRLLETLEGPEMMLYVELPNPTDKTPVLTVRW